MKYFQHDLLAREDDKIWELIDRHGLTGYGAWWVILEELYKAEEDSFKVDATETWLKRLAKNLDISDYRTLPRLLDTFAELGLIDAQLWHEHVIFSPAVVARGDYYVRQKALARQRKQKERSTRKAKAQEVAEAIHQEKLEKIESVNSHEDVTRDKGDVTEDGGVMSRTNTDPDTDPDPSLDSNPSSSPTSPPPPKREAEAAQKTASCEIRTLATVVVEPEQSVVPDLQSEELGGCPGSQRVNGSAPRRMGAQDAFLLCQHYNQARPDKWAEYRNLTISSELHDQLERLWQYSGNTLDEAKKVLGEACGYARLSPFYSGQKVGRNGEFFQQRTLQWLLRGDRFIEWSGLFETVKPSASNPQQRNGPTDAQLQDIHSQYRQRQKASNFDKYKQYGWFEETA